MLILEQHGQRLVVVLNDHRFVQVTQLRHIQRPQFANADVLHARVKVVGQFESTLPQ